MRKAMVRCKDEDSSLGKSLTQMSLKQAAGQPAVALDEKPKRSICFLSGLSDN